MTNAITETYTAPTGAAVLTYAPDARFHTVTLATPFAPPEVFRLAVIDNARAKWQALRAELTAAGYAKLSA